MISVVLCGRNDNYGGHLNERFSYSINGFLQVFDEVIYVDWNTDPGKKILTDEIEIKDRSKLKVIEVNHEKASELLQDESAQKMCEVLARNVGIRRAKGDIIVSSNIDIIPFERVYLDILIQKLQKGEMITFTRNDIELSDIKKNCNPESLELWKVPMIFGAEPIRRKLISPYISINKEIIEKFPENKHHVLSSIICGCGDFQIAYKETWYKIRGFEENLTKRLYLDTSVQYKVIMSGGVVTACSFPPIYHLDHERNDSPEFTNSMEMTKYTGNSENWGFVNENLH
tara:strand:- start:105 stop:962 length:858 start_codon:yes stop_codon:yes gene_type:complete